MRQLNAVEIEPTKSEWASPILLVHKPDCPKVFCMDYRRINAKPFANSYPLTRMDDSIDSLGKTAVFSTLGANSGYW